MSRSKLALATVLVATGFSLHQAGNAGEQMKMAASKPAASPSEADRKIIHSAMQAAPAKVAEKATIVAAKPDGSMRTVRAGSNGFTCMADNPATPGPDPMCMDAAAWAWAGAWMSHKPPAGRESRIHVHAQRRHGCQQYRSLRRQARARTTTGSRPART